MRVSFWICIQDGDKMELRLPLKAGEEPASGEVKIVGQFFELLVIGQG